MFEVSRCFHNILCQLTTSRLNNLKFKIFCAYILPVARTVQKLYRGHDSRS